MVEKMCLYHGHNYGSEHGCQYLHSQTQWNILKHEGEVEEWRGGVRTREERVVRMGKEGLKG